MCVYVWMYEWMNVCMYGMECNVCNVFMHERINVLMPVVYVLYVMYVMSVMYVMYVFLMYACCVCNACNVCM